MGVVVDHFKVLRPSFESRQELALQWIAHVHAYTKTHFQNTDSHAKNLEETTALMERIVQRFSCLPDKILRRGSEIEDFTHLNFSEMKIFNITASPQGAPLSERMTFFARATQGVFEQFYKHTETAPAHLIHVTCTGYASPSAAQNLISQKNWGENCQVTHAYHMGCYASLPALRMAQGFLSSSAANSPSVPSRSVGERVDIVHTELCTLHFNPYLHTPEQFVIQSLFADGFISYSVVDKKNHKLTPGKNAFEILAIHEVIFAESQEAMTWKLSEFGFSMTISRDVPAIIAENIEQFLHTLFHQAGHSFTEEKKDVIFAIHPGGPKIIEHIAEILKLSDDRVAVSHKILNSYGNMSSATLPHIWEDLSRSHTKPGSLVVSLAFGPGLTVAGSLMRVL